MGVLQGEEQPPAPTAPFTLPEPLGDALTGCAGVKRDGTGAKPGTRAVPAGTRAGRAIPVPVWDKECDPSACLG